MPICLTHASLIRSFHRLLDVSRGRRAESREKRAVQLRVWFAVVLSPFALVYQAPVDAASVATISAPFVTAYVGETITIPVTVTNAADLAIFQFDLGFAPLVVTADAGGATLGTLLPGDWFLTSPGTVDNATGWILGVSGFGSAVTR